MAGYVDIQIKIASLTQSAQVRADLTFGQLLDEIRREFKHEILAERNDPDECFLWEEGGKVALPLHQTVSEVVANIFVFGSDVPTLEPIRYRVDKLAERKEARALGDHLKPLLRVIGTQDIYHIRHSPTIVGRRGASNYPHLKRIELDSQYEHINKTSRDHAAILKLEQEDIFYVIPLQEDKMVGLTRRRHYKKLEYGYAHPLEVGDEVELGQVRLVFSQ